VVCPPATNPRRPTSDARAGTAIPSFRADAPATKARAGNSSRPGPVVGVFRPRDIPAAPRPAGQRHGSEFSTRCRVVGVPICVNR
jgi:hypothetical protein